MIPPSSLMYILIDLSYACGHQRIHGVLDELASNSAIFRPNFWRRNMDDTFCTIKKRTKEEFIEHLT